MKNKMLWGKEKKITLEEEIRKSFVATSESDLERQVYILKTEAMLGRGGMEAHGFGEEQFPRKGEHMSKN